MRRCDFNALGAIFLFVFSPTDDLSGHKPNASVRTSTARNTTQLFYWRTQVSHWTSLLSWHGLFGQVCQSCSSWWLVVLARFLSQSLLLRFNSASWTIDHLHSVTVWSIKWSIDWLINWSIFRWKTRHMPSTKSDPRMCIDTWLLIWWYVSSWREMLSPVKLHQKMRQDWETLTNCYRGSWK